MTESFAALGVPTELVEPLRRQRITEPFEIQAMSIPDALAGRDILGRAPTGSGKTLAFGIPTLARLAESPRAASHRPRALILSPTRELAEQISRELEPLADEIDRRVLAVYGGVSLSGQIKKLRRGIDVLVACPGRLLDLVDQGEVALRDVEVAVVDEADRMADMGFLPDVRKILDLTSDDRQTILFSATLDRDVKILVDNYQNDPAEHQVAEVEPDLSKMTHRFIKTPKTDRVRLAADLIAETGPSIVFVRTRHGVDRLSRQLGQEGIKAGFLHGGRSQSQRDRALEVFVEGKVDALIATDVAARGIHVDGVNSVIHYDPPADHKDYVHRSGRTARAGASGTVISFLDKPQVADAKKMQKRLGLEAEIEDKPEPKPRSSRPEAVRNRYDPKPNSSNQRKPKGKGGKPKAGKPQSGKPKSAKPKNAKSTDTRSSGAKSNGAKSNGTRSTDTRSNGAKSNGAKSNGTRSRAGARYESDESTDGPRRSRSRTDAGRSERSGSSRPKSAGSKPSGPKSAGPKPSGPKSSGSKSTKPASKSSGSARSGKPGSGKPGERSKSGGRSESGPGRKATAGSARPTAGKAKAKAKSSRSGKPRPKNRKNLPKGARRS